MLTMNWNSRGRKGGKRTFGGRYHRLPKRLGSLHSRAAAAVLGHDQNNLGSALSDQAVGPRGEEAPIWILVQT